MSQKLFVRVSPDFDPATLGRVETFHPDPEVAEARTVLVCMSDLGLATHFDERGYDAFDHDEEARVHEVEIRTDRIAGRDDLMAAVARASVRVEMTDEEKLAQGIPRGHLAYVEHSEANQLLSRPEVRAELEAAGFEAWRGFVAISNLEPEATVLWRPDSFALGPRVQVGPEMDGPEAASPSP